MCLIRRKTSKITIKMLKFGKEKCKVRKEAVLSSRESKMILRKTV